MTWDCVLTSDNPLLHKWEDFQPYSDKNLSILKAHPLTHLSGNPFLGDPIKGSISTWRALVQHQKKAQEESHCLRLCKPPRKNERRLKINMNSSKERRGGRAKRHRHPALPTRRLLGTTRDIPLAATPNYRMRGCWQGQCIPSVIARLYSSEQSVTPGAIPLTESRFQIPSATKLLPSSPWGRTFSTASAPRWGAARLPKPARTLRASRAATPAVLQSTHHTFYFF